LSFAKFRFFIWHDFAKVVSLVLMLICLNESSKQDKKFYPKDLLTDSYGAFGEKIK
jgi:hypothetical protein